MQILPPVPFFLPDRTWPIVYQFDEPQSVAVQAKNTDAMTRAGKNVADALTASQISAGAASNLTGVDTLETEEETQDGEEDSASTAFVYRSQDLLEQAQQLQEMSNATNQSADWMHAFPFW